MQHDAMSHTAWNACCRLLRLLKYKLKVHSLDASLPLDFRHSVHENRNENLLPLISGACRLGQIIKCTHAMPCTSGERSVLDIWVYIGVIIVVI